MPDVSLVLALAAICAVILCALAALAVALVERFRGRNDDDPVEYGEEP